MNGFTLLFLPMRHYGIILSLDEFWLQIVKIQIFLEHKSPTGQTCVEVTYYFYYICQESRKTSFSA